MIIQTRYENTRCSICKTHIPFGADCVWVSGTPGVTCTTPCQPPVASKKPRKVSGRVTPAPPVSDARTGTATQARAIPESDTLTRIPCPQAGLEAFRDTCDTFDLPSLLSLQTLINEAVERCRVDIHNSPGESPHVGPRALPAPGQATDVPEPASYHVECKRCGHIWDRKGFAVACNFCASADVACDKLGTVFNPIATHTCDKPWAFHDPDNVAHTRNCTSCQLTPRACTTRNDRITKIANKPVVDKPRNPKFSF